jgi:hypothetical protein
LLICIKKYEEILKNRTTKKASYVVLIQWNSKKAEFRAEFRAKFEFLKLRLETRLEKLDFSSKLTRNPTRKTRIFLVFLIEFLLNIMF